MIVLNSIMLAQASGEGSGGMVQMFIMMGIIFVILYFFMIRPQQKKAKDQKRFISEMKKGDKIVTIGGIHGIISKVEGDQVIIEVEGHNKLKIEKSAVSVEATKNTSSESK